MKRNWINYIVGLLLAGFTLSSCLNSEETDYSQYQDCNITAFSVGDIATTRHTLTAAGKDSTYTETLSGDSISWEIDQLSGKIYNLDSLPKGTNVTKVVATITANGLLARVGNKDSLNYFNNGSDSVDYTSPVTFRVIPYANANSGDYTTKYRTYTVEIRVHKMAPYAWTWDSIPAATSFPGAAFTGGQKAYQLDGKIYVFGTDGTTVSVASSSDGLDWTEAQPLTGNSTIDYSTILADTQARKFYGKAEDGTLCVSSDGIAWEPAFESDYKISTLLYKENNIIYAVANGKMASIDETGLLSEYNVDGDEAYLPSANVYRFTFDGEVIPENKQYVFVGTGAESVDTAVVSWQKSGSQNWMYVGNAGDNIGAKACPALNHLAVFSYGKYLVAFGGDNLSERASLKGFQTIYVSDDYGISWLPGNTTNVFPTVFRSDENRNQAFSYIIKDGKLWLFWSKPVKDAFIWRGYLNKAHFERK